MKQSHNIESFITESNSGIWRYEELLPNVSIPDQITMGEGNTPLVKSNKIADEIGLSSLYFKMESSNPTGSYKDRIAAMGVSRAIQQGRSACIGTSSGNAGASFAAYSARAGIPYHLLVLEHIVESKLTQVLVHGAEVKRIKNFGESEKVGEKVFNFIEDHATNLNWEMMITAFKYNPVAMEAVKTISFEVYQNLGNRVPDAVFIPVGGGGLFTGIWKGFKEIRQRDIDSKVPNIIAVQSEGCSNIVRAWEQSKVDPLDGDSTSQISGLQVPNPPDGHEVLEALSQQGWGHMIDDSKTWRWQKKLALDEGILCEPASAISLAGVEQALSEGRINKDSDVVCIITGAGYKDSKSLKKIADQRPEVGVYDIDQLQI
ncbi:threonine synthase [Virgibacillus subterraneus]|uniref:Threonine synthase n=1 Tax=Virgibacillus subterraneus TaxID=621109 RepID=A0A1H9G6B5_9BACI|nr:threonine synthase [Virgibacillus subterraneus]SEQ45583.1 threonine synthase [Virgibacillus subterraneus]